MTWIKVLLIASFVVLLVVMFRHRHRVALRAGSRIGAIGLFVAAVASIADPDIPQTVAQEVGVGRGTDLILYLLVVVFALTTMGLYFRLRETDHRVVQLGRALAIAETLRREEATATSDPVESAGPEEALSD